MRSAAYSLLFVCAVAAIGITAVPSAMAASGPVALDSVPQAKLSDKAAMQNGAKTFMSYCLGCHGVSAMRYSRLSDIGMNEEQIKALLPEGKKTGDYIRTSISRNDAKEWFGAAPPDLSLTARARSSHSGTGTDWVYTFLRTYVEDPSRPTGWNNKTYPGVGMPHVLWEMQKTKSPAEFDSAVGDLAAFLNYVAEPAQFTRKTFGIVVLVFLAFFFVIAWRLNKAYWKKIR
ncbi:MAG: cytochrome c1 [Betaproteobacteria bacterium]|nr:cytochrome c1 [Betaproteobacteria bacterium]